MPEKYYRFAALKGGLTCEGYRLEDKSTGPDPVLALKPDMDGDIQHIQESRIGTYADGTYWSKDPDPNRAYAVMLQAARTEAAAAKNEYLKKDGALDDIRVAGLALNRTVPRKPPAVYLEFQDDAEGRRSRLSLKDAMAMLGIEWAPGLTVSIGLDRDGIDLHASVDTGETASPGISVGADARQAGELRLGRFDLPNDTYPTRLSACLYAGCTKYEPDGPIAAVTHEVTDDARVLYRAGRHGSGKDRMKKLVYVDYRAAESRPWSEATEGTMPEHAEDEG